MPMRAAYLNTSNADISYVAFSKEKTCSETIKVDVGGSAGPRASFGMAAHKRSNASQLSPLLLETVSLCEQHRVKHHLI